MSKDLLAAFREAYGNLKLQPLLEPRELERFRVDYGSQVIADLEQLVEDSPDGDDKIIFTGHRGCGKSTLLAELKRRFNQRYFVVFFSIADTIEMSDVNHINILFAIAVNLMFEAEKQQIPIPPSSKEAFYKWFATRTRVESQEVGTQASLEFPPFPGIKLLELIKLKLQAEAKVREELKQQFQRRVSDLIARINEIAAIIYRATSQDVLVIIDDLDKLDLAVAREIYQDNIKALLKPNFRIILTIPISALRETKMVAVMNTETNNQIVPMPVSKLFGKGKRCLPDAVPQQEAKDTLCQILTKRIPQELLEPQVAEQIVVKSGGVLRELVRITNECCRICLRLVRKYPERENIKIDQAVLQEAVNKLRLDFATPIGTADYQILKNTYQNCTPDDPTAQKFLDLLHGLYVLEYRNSEIWYDIHPIVTDILKERGIL
ncbi:MAG: ATP-binding protein [Symploca sp. SIO1B1]|nr:ATP-binding protein [Symploca sp. SIO1C2]NER95108.1 ATP-binding protein [Symploca sp. SIO1B1]